MQGWPAAAAMDGETKGVDDNLSFRVQSVSQGEVRRGDSYLLCRGVPSVQCCAPSHFTKLLLRIMFTP